jgi:hypothetical protein
MPRWFAWLSVVMLLILILLFALSTPGLGAGVGILWIVIASLTLGLAGGVRAKATAV